MRNQTVETAEVAVFTLRVPRPQLDELREVAARAHRSLNGELRQMIDNRLAEERAA